jgi:hypothetical protein
MERFKQTITKLENDVSELKQFKTKIQGSTQSSGDIHYCTGAQEFGEYSLEELDTFRFVVAASPGQNNIMTYSYALQNLTPELMAYLRVQGKCGVSTEYIPVDIENFETYFMKKGGAPFALTTDIQKCLDSKLWEFAWPNHPELVKNIRKEFFIDITINFKHEYKITPHISFYITPLSNTLDGCVIHEITTKEVVFRIKYGNLDKTVHKYKKDIYSGLKLHYSINGVVEEKHNLLD